MNKGVSFSLLVALHVSRIITWSFDYFFSDVYSLDIVWHGFIFQNSPVSSQLNISSGLYSFNICQRFSLIVSKSSISALVAFPCIWYCLRLCHFLKLSTQPLDPLNLSSFNKKAKLKAFVERISSVIMRLALSVLSTHITNASSMRGNGVFLLCFKLA